jgi:hypothetical protein
MAYNNCKFDDPSLATYAKTSEMIELESSYFGKESYRPSKNELESNFGGFPRYGYFSRKKFHFCQCPEIRTYSKQTGASTTNRLFIPGRWNFDIYLDVKSSYKLAAYGLDDVASKFIKKKKIYLPAKTQFEYFISGLKDDPTPQDIANTELLDKYCKKDCELPKGLFEYFNLRNKYAGGSRANMLNIEDQFWRGKKKYIITF